MLKKGALIAALGYTIILAGVCLMSLKGLPDVPVSFADKIFHFLAYFVFVLLWYFALFFFFNLKKSKAVLYAFVWAVFFGLIIEVLQDTLTASRALDVYDALANSLGALIASLVLWFKKR